MNAGTPLEGSIREATGEATQRGARDAIMDSSRLEAGRWPRAKAAKAAKAAFPP